MVRRNAATRETPPAGTVLAVGTASSLALFPRASPGATGADPVDGLTTGRPNSEDDVAGMPAGTVEPDGALLSTAMTAPVSVPVAASMATPTDSIRRRPPRLIARAIRRSPSVRCTQQTMPQKAVASPPGHTVLTSDIAG